MMRSKIVLIVNSKTIVRLLVWICMSRSVRPSDMVQFHSIDLRSHLVAKFMKNHIYNSYKMMMKITQFQQNKPIIYTLYEKILHLHFISRRLSSEKPWETLCNLQSCKQLKFKTFFACLEIGANFHCKRIAYWCNTNNPVHWFDQSELLIYIYPSILKEALLFWWQNLASLVKYETNILTEKFVVETPTVSLTLKRQDRTSHQICPFQMDNRQQNSMVNKAYTYT